MENKKGVSKGVIFGVLIIILLVMGVIGGAFYIHLNQPEVVEEETLEGANISLTYADEQNLFSIENAVATSDIVGISADSAELFFDFTVKTTIEEANEVKYEVILVKDETISTALNSNVKVYLEKETNGTYTEVAGPVTFEANVDDSKFGDNAMSLYQNTKTSSGTDNYRLRMWISDTAMFDAGQIQNFGVKVAINGKAR